MSNRHWSAIEDDRYSALYRDRGYPHGDPMRLVRAFNYGHDWATVDLGCGTAELARHFSDYVGIDCSTYIIDKNRSAFPDATFYQSSLDSLACIERDKFDLAICADVMEHIPSAHVDAVLASISQINASVFSFSICTRPSFILGPSGENLHPTVMRASEWVDKMLPWFTNFSCLNPRSDTIFIECTSTNALARAE
jgi:trans-aconitate methyltransferase